ncbi:MAG: trigger factor [Tannerella sp.]|jgi:trigger factor|nr:trigger factor [Tannerella sp.]
MNISFCNRDAVKGILKIEVAKADYAEQLEKSLRSIRQKANMPGFRKGMVPLSLIKKMYGRQAMAEEIEKVLSDNLFKYIRDNKIDLLCDPLPNQTEQKELDFDSQEDFEFYFDLSFSPEISLKLTKKNKLPYYHILVDEQKVDDQIASDRRNQGSYTEVEEVSGEQDLIKGSLVELAEGQPKTGGIWHEETALMTHYFTNKDIAGSFLGAKVGGSVDFNPKKACEGAENAQAELASLLGISKEEAANVDADFRFEIKSITHYEPAELNQAFYDKLFGEGTAVTSEEAYRAKIRESLENLFAQQSDYKLSADARPYLLEKAGELSVADDLLKRKYQDLNPKASTEEIEKAYPAMLESIKYSAIVRHIFAENNLSISEDDLKKEAAREARNQFARYGINVVADDMIARYAESMLKDEKQAAHFEDEARIAKLVGWLKETITLQDKDVSFEEFGKLFESSSQEDQAQPEEE